MQTFSDTDLYEIYHQSYRIPIGIFDGKGNLLKLYLDGGQRLTELYLADSRRLLNRVQEKTEPMVTSDQKGSGWGICPVKGMVVLLGPVQTGHNPNYPFYNVPEYSRAMLCGVVRSFACLLLGKQTEVKETRNLFWETESSRQFVKETERSQQLVKETERSRQFIKETERSRQLFDHISDEKKVYNAYNELYDAIHNGDLETLKSILDSDELNTYLDRYMTSLSESRMVFHYASIKSYHTAQDVCGNTADLMAIAANYRKAAVQYRSGNACRSGMMSMFYDYAALVSRFHDSSYSANVQKALHYINENLYTRITMKELAHYCAMGTSTLEHTFKAETGRSVTDMIRKKKIEKACYFLKYTQIPCADVAARLGYCSTSVFITRFKREMGMTPGEYRRKERK